MKKGPTFLDVETAFRSIDFVVLGAESARALNERAPAAAQLPVPTEDATALLLGTTRAFWTRFLAEGALARPDPLDDLVEHLAHTTLTSLFGGDGYRVVFSHVLLPAPYPFQRLAEEFSLPVGRHGLSLHPKFGSWFALRAAATVPGLAHPAPAQPWAPCEDCPEPCRRVRPSSTVPELSLDLRIALAAREACPVGAGHAYESRAVAYHYTKNSRYLSAKFDAE